MDGATIGIVGSGPLGIGLACEVKKAGLNPIFFLRTPKELDFFSGSILENGSSVPFSFPIATAKDYECVSLLFFATKAFDLENALCDHLGKSRSRKVVISLSNGWTEPLLQNVSRVFIEHEFRMGISTFGVRSTPVADEYAICPGVFEWGPLLEEQIPSQTETLLFEKNSSFHWLSNPKAAVKKKWLFNVVINSLTGAEGLSRNGMLLDGQNALHTVFQEAYQFGIEAWGDWESSKDSLWNQLIQLIQQTAENENSMVRDLRLGRRTENSYLAGLVKNSAQYPWLTGLAEKINTSLHIF